EGLGPSLSVLQRSSPPSPFPKSAKSAADAALFLLVSHGEIHPSPAVVFAREVEQTGFLPESVGEVRADELNQGIHGFLFVGAVGDQIDGAALNDPQRED